MVTKIYTAQPHLLTAHIISIEVDLSFGLHSFSIVGLAGRAVDEARDRISAAIKNSGWKSPKNKNQKVVISLAPADLKKDSTMGDLAMAVGYLVAAKEIHYYSDDSTLFIGELSLNGNIQPVRGILPIIHKAKEYGFRSCVVPLANAAEAALVDGIDIYPASTLIEVTHHIEKKKNIKPHSRTIFQQKKIDPEIDMGDIIGQFSAKRALEIAVAGGHNIVMYGPPGTGKTMLARATKGIMPQLTFEQTLEVSAIASLYSDSYGEQNIITTPPFRSPHHTASYVSVVGGGSLLRPGEITLAHHGILFLDEMAEFSSQVLEALREPLEEHVVRISRARGSAVYPARFILIGAINPCRCGNFTNLHTQYSQHTKKCTCSAYDISRYQKKISGPIADRIDMWVEVGNIEYETLEQKNKQETTATIAARVQHARIIQQERYISHNETALIHLNSELSHRHIQSIITLDKKCSDLLNNATKKLALSVRGYQRVIKTARTIADLAGEKNITPDHIQEALSYRSR